MEYGGEFFKIGLKAASKTKLICEEQAEERQKNEDRGCTERRKKKNASPWSNRRDERMKISGAIYRMKFGMVFGNYRCVLTLRSEFS